MWETPPTSNRHCAGGQMAEQVLDVLIPSGSNTRQKQHEENSFWRNSCKDVKTSVSPVVIEAFGASIPKLVE